MLLYSWFPLIWYATYPCSEKNESWPTDPIPNGVGCRVGVYRRNICYRVAGARNSLQFDMQHHHVLKKFNFDLLIPSQGGWSAGKIFPTMLLHLLIPFYLICNMTIFWKSYFCPFILIARVGWVGGGAFCVEIFATMLLHLWISLIWYATWPCSEKDEFWTIDPIPKWGGGRGVCGWNICYHVAVFVIPLYLICNMAILWKRFIWTFWPQQQGRGGGSAGKIFATMLLQNLICNMTMFWKKWILTYWHHPQRGGTGVGVFGQNICYHVAASCNSLKDTGFNFTVRNLPKRICSYCYILSSKAFLTN